MKNLLKKITIFLFAIFTALSFSVVSFAEDGATGGATSGGSSVSDKIVDGVNDAFNEVKSIVKGIGDSVIFPALWIAAALVLIVGIGKVLFDYHNHTQIKWGFVIVPLIVLIVLLVIPSFIWGIIGI